MLVEVALVGLLDVVVEEGGERRLLELGLLEGMRDFGEQDTGINCAIRFVWFGVQELSWD